MENITKTINRIKYFIDYKGVSFNKLSLEIGVSNSYFSKMFKNNASIGSDILEKIGSIYPELNTNWLITGKGKMLNESSIDEKKGNIMKEEEPSYHKLPPGPCQQCKLRDEIISTQKITIEALEQLLKKNKK